MRVPFVSNTSDNLHCFQAAFLMVLRALGFEKEYTFEELDVITQKKKDGYTWPLAAILWMLQNKVDVNIIEIFEYKKFSEKGVHLHYGSFTYLKLKSFSKLYRNFWH